MKQAILRVGIGSLPADVEKTLRGLLKQNAEWGATLVPNAESAELVVMDRPLPVAKGQTAILVLAEGKKSSELETWGLPLRAEEVSGTLRRAHAMAHLNTDLGNAIQMLEENLGLAERLDRKLRTTRYDGIAGLHAASFYSPGERPGGDYFDLAENREKTRVLVLLSDSSSYGLASTVMASLLKISSILGVESTEAPARLVETVWSQVSRVMKPKDQWSIFLGVLHRKTLEFNYVHYGSSRVLLRSAEGKVEELRATGPSLKGGAPEINPKNSVIQLEPGSTLLAISDGFVGLPGSEELSTKLIGGTMDPQTMSLEAKYFLQKTIGKENLPLQDCTMGAVLIDAKVLRLAKRAQGGSAGPSTA